MAKVLKQMWAWSIDQKTRQGTREEWTWYLQEMIEIERGQSKKGPKAADMTWHSF